jgi:hypothetical protein
MKKSGVIAMGVLVLSLLGFMGCSSTSPAVPASTSQEVPLVILTPQAEIFLQDAQDSDFQTDGKGTITKYVGRNSRVNIPAQIGGKPVTGIGEKAFAEIELVGVVIPDSVTSIGDYAFYGNKLTSVTIGSGVKTIEGAAFASNQLTSVIIPNSVTSIGGSAFYGNKLTNVTIPNSVTSIGNYAFAGNQLTSLTIGNSVTSIGEGAFAYNQLTSVTIPNSVTSIGGSAFSGNQLTSVTIGNSVTYIEVNAFANNQLTSVTLGANVVFPKNAFNDTIFYNYIFNDRKAGTYTVDTKGQSEKREGDFGYVEMKYGICIVKYYGSLVNRLVIPEAINDLAVKGIDGAIFDREREVYTGAFADKNITRVLIPDSVTYIGGGAFYGNKLTSITIPDSVLYIGGYAFARNQLTSVTIPNSVTYIEELAFSSNQLTSVTIPNSVTYIGLYAFSSNQLTSVTIPNSVTSIEHGVFAWNQLTSVTIGSGVTSISMGGFHRRGAFSNNSNLTAITVDKNNTQYASVDGVVFSKDLTVLVCYPDGKGSVYSIPNGVTSIGYLAFAGSQLKSVTIPNSVTYIGQGAFEGIQLTNITIPANIELNVYYHGASDAFRQSFSNNFGEFYNNNGKKAGTYTYSGGTWTFQPKR